MKFWLLIVFMAAGMQAYTQEICDNAVDDDFDGLIDLNDPDCECTTGNPENLLQNHSFEEYETCPFEEAQIAFADHWQVFNSATTDLYNTCGLTTLGFGFPEPPSPFPGDEGGEGYAGITMSGGGAYGWEEHIGQILETPLTAGTSYTFTFYGSWCNDLTTVNLGIWGSPEDDDYTYLLPTCPDGEGSWMALYEETVTFPDAAWNEFTWTFTPEEDIYAFVFGFGCEEDLWDVSYFYVDEVSITQENFVNITEEGDWCNGDLVLNASIDSTGGTWQWYKDGIALPGETDDNIAVELYGIGDYSAVYFVEEGCLRGNHLTSIYHELEANFSAEAICFEETMIFENTSLYEEDVEPDWNWDFQDGDVAEGENPTHLYYEPGIYPVELIVSADGACNDTVVVDVEVKSKPLAEYAFIMNELSSLDGATGGCIGESTTFNNLSTFEDGEITGFSWTFGDGETSEDENPIYLYETSGSYTATLAVLGDNGCVGEMEHNILIKDELVFSINDQIPSCTSFDDGSVAVDVVDATDIVFYEITDADGELRNIDNSPEALDLEAGWYFIDLHEQYGCSAEDSIELIDPEPLEITYTTTDEMFGDDGLIDITVSGGTPPYTFDWNNDETGDFDDPEDLSASGGTYTIVVKDDSGCQVELTIVLESQLGLENNANVELIIFPNPLQDFTQIIYEPGFTADHSIVLLNALGQEVYRNDNLSGTKTTIGREELSTGVYTLIFTTSGKNHPSLTYQLIVE